MKASFAFYCLCGVSMVGEVSPESKLTGLEAAFDSIHHGDGHGRTDRITAHNARRRAARKALREATR